MPNILDLDEWLTTTQAAHKLGVSRQRVYSIARSRGWESVTVGRERLYQRADVAGYTQRPPGRPKHE